MNLNFLHNHRFFKYQLYFLVGILVFLQIILLVNLFVTVSGADLVTGEKIKKVESAMRRIDGVEVDESKANLYPVAITIDNHFDSWPNYGLSKASVVYEIPVEGSTTRFLAIYTPALRADEISKIGPVRSTRPYFVELAREYGALLAHSGGSPKGLKRIEELGVPNLEEISWYGPDYFWRVYSRNAPHNLFSSSDNLAQGVVDFELGNITPTYESWKFSDKFEGVEASKIKIEFSNAEVYDVKYAYDEDSNSYLRAQGGDEHIDGLNGKQIGVDNVVIQFVPREVILDSEGRKKINILGKGEAWIARDGKMIKGSWEKDDYSSRTMFYGTNGDEIEFRSGSIWISVVPGNKKVEIE